MKNIKFVAVFAASGFVLSLIFGFFSHSRFGRIFLTALIFAVIFGLLGLAISFIFNRFLDSDTVAETAQPAQGDGINPSESKPVLGQHVDLVIQEEELEQTGNQNHYDVGENHQMLNESDYKHNSESEANSEQEAPQIQKKNEFVPIRNLETVNNFSGSESMTRKESDERQEIIAEQNEKKGDEIDVLPDMSDLQLGSDNSSSDSDTFVLSDSEEADFVHSATNYKSSDAANGEIKDASLMAKAISSILAEES